MSTSRTGRRSSRSGRRAILFSIVLAAITGAASGYLVAKTQVGGGGGSDGAELRVMRARIDELRTDVNRLTETAERARILLERRQSDAGTAALTGFSAASAANADDEPTGIARTAADLKTLSGDERREALMSSEGIAAAAYNAFEERDEALRRQLYMSRPECQRPDAEGMVICSVTLRNNLQQVSSVSLTQFGSSARLAGGSTISSIRMRPRGETLFAYSAALRIPGEANRGFEISFGPVPPETVAIDALQLTANKLRYTFDNVALN